MRKICYLLAVTVLITSCSSMKKNSTSFTVASNPVVAHRGAWKKNALPENSIASLKEAIRLGCSGSEFDVRMSSDDSLVINHDPEYHNLPIEKTPYSELVKTKLSNGEKLPTLKEYLLAGKTGNPGTLLVVEIKPSDVSKERARSIAEKVVNLVRELKVEQMVAYISFDIEICKKIVEMDAKAAVQYLNGDYTPDQLKALNISGLDYNLAVFRKNPDWIEKAKNNKLVLNAWTVNAETDMKWFLENKFNQITTNEPELLFTLLK